MRTRKPVTVTPDKMQERVDARMKCGAPRTLDREEETLDEIWRRKIKESLDDPRPDIPAEEAFRQLRAHHADQMKAGKRSS